MTFDQGIAFATLIASLGLFVWGRWRYDIVALIALITVALAGLVDRDQILSGFGHPAVITVAAVLVISHALRRAGVVDVVARILAPFTRNTFTHIVGLSGVAAICSAFMNNVGAIAIMLPVALASCAERERSPAIVLMPLAFGSILGGLMTMIGTPPNIIIATYRASITGEPFGMFDFSPVGIPIALTGLVFVALIGWRLIPTERIGKKSTEELFHIQDYITEVQIAPESPLIGLTLLEAEAKTGEDVMITGLARGDGKMRHPAPWQVLRGGDYLLIRAEPTDLKPAMDDNKLELVATESGAAPHGAPENTRILEAVVTPGSRLEGRSPHFLRWRSGYALDLLGIAREGEPIRMRIKRAQIKAGDILLLQAAESSGGEILSDLGLLPLPERGLALGTPRRILLPILIFGFAIAMSALGVLPIAVAFLAAIIAFVLLDILPLRELYTNIDWPIIVLLGAMIPVGQALEQTGATTLIASTLLSFTGALPAWAILALVMAITMTLSDLINNAATALVMAPIAVAIAQGLGVSIDPFLMAVAV
ncbi:MAG: SLC13 family permease, partial [Alphaproteobacteria bacterium]